MAGPLPNHHARRLMQLAGVLVAAALLLLLPGGASAAFLLPPLPFVANATEPAIDGRTNTLHNTRHHAAYINNLNAALANFTQLQSKTLTELVAMVGTGLLPAEIETRVRNNGGGAWNHNLWWNELAPFGSRNTRTSKISSALKTAIKNNFGTVEAMLAEVQAKALAQFGSGWAWVVVPTRNTSALVVTATANQDNPLMQIPSNNATTAGIPILGVDVWEHSYYLNYGPDRAGFLREWAKVIDWKAVSANYAAAIKGTTDVILGGAQYNRQQ